MRLRQSGRDLVEVSALERRQPYPPGGPELLWFSVTPKTPLDADAVTELVDDVGAVRIYVEWVLQTHACGRPHDGCTLRKHVAWALDGDSLTAVR